MTEKLISITVLWIQFISNVNYLQLFNDILNISSHNKSSKTSFICLFIYSFIYCQC